MITKIADHFGLKNQKVKTIEECSELITAIAKNDLENITEEIADVLIMVYQLIYLYDIEDDVNEMIEFKIKRTVERYGICKK